MEIRNAITAREWLAAWAGRPRRGILLVTISGLDAALALDITYRRSTADVEGALAVLRAAQQESAR